MHWILVSTEIFFCFSIHESPTSRSVRIWQTVKEQSSLTTFFALSGENENEISKFHTVFHALAQIMPMKHESCFEADIML